jgi:Ca2+-binding EF-hand superfamily protein
MASAALARPADRSPAQRQDRDGTFNDWTPEAFATIDRNNDNRITRQEWSFEADAFERADHNGNGVVTRAEFLGDDIATSTSARRDRASRLPGRFAAWDANGDRRLSRAEWRGTRERFDRLDTDRDDQLQAGELGDQTARTNAETRAYRAGYDRGLAEGQQAGRDDRQRDEWDLEGQRELEQADSGYQPAHGSRTEYQSGYRHGFREGYRRQWANQ